MHPQVLQSHQHYIHSVSRARFTLLYLPPAETAVVATYIHTRILRASLAYTVWTAPYRLVFSRHLVRSWSIFKSWWVPNFSLFFTSSIILLLKKKPTGREKKWVIAILNIFLGFQWLDCKMSGASWADGSVYINWGGNVLLPSVRLCRGFKEEKHFLHCHWSAF